MIDNYSERFKVYICPDDLEERSMLMFTRFIGAIIVLVLIMAFLPTILEGITWILLIVLGFIGLVIALIALFRIMRPSRGSGTYFIFRR
jgi:hypothetical protein